MKPLTIEELKVGEWVWVVDIESPKHGSGYWQVHGFAETHIHLNQGPSIWVAPKALYGKDWIAYKNKEQAEAKGEIVELPNGWLDTLKLITCAAMCYADIESMIANGMKDNKELANLFFNIPRVQGSVNDIALKQLAESELDCNKIIGIEEVLNVMPIFKAQFKDFDKKD